MKILIVTYGSANRWTGGVYKYFQSITPLIEKRGHDLCFFDTDKTLLTQPGGLRGIQFVTAGIDSDRFARFFDKVKPDAIHIQAEFGIGVGARNFCVKQGIPYSSAYHTNFDKLLQYYKVPSFWVWPYLRWFYKPASLIFTHTERLERLLQGKAITNPVATFPPGVNPKEWFYDPQEALLQGYPRPYFVTMSRMSKEKNISAFLDLQLPGTKIVIGEGPHKKHLMRKYQGKALFLPYENPRKYLSMCDVFVSASDFGALDLVLLEALSCGLPIASYPVMGPLDVLKQGETGYTSHNLQEAALAALSLKKEACLELAKEYTWEKTTEAFLKHQIRIT